MTLKTTVKKFVKCLYYFTLCVLRFLQENHNQFDAYEIIEILDTAKCPKWHNAITAARIDEFKISYEESGRFVNGREV